MNITKERARELRVYIEKSAKSLNDGDALEAVELFPKWSANVDYILGVRLRFNDKLYRVLQAHTSASQWTPDVATSLYAEVEKPGQGDTPETAIPYSGNMELFSGKYYTQYGVIYLCIRDTGVPVYNTLSDLVNIYVQVYGG